MLKIAKTCVLSGFICGYLEKAYWFALFLALLVLFSGCGSLTGIPGHGGGKRFAVEQELVAAATRATIKKIDLSAIRGKKVNLFMNAIDDVGS